MDIKTLQSDQDYQKALLEVERLWDAPANSPESDIINIITLLIEDYEKRVRPIEAPDPIEFIQQVMEDRGLTRKDMESIIGPRGRVSDILTKKRPLTLDMIRRLSEKMQLPTDILVRPYRTTGASNKTAA